jgi:hypothetical protein
MDDRPWFIGLRKYIQRGSEKSGLFFMHFQDESELQASVLPALLSALLVNLLVPLT